MKGTQTHSKLTAAAAAAATTTTTINAHKQLKHERNEYSRTSEKGGVGQFSRLLKFSIYPPYHMHSEHGSSMKEWRLVTLPSNSLPPLKNPISNTYVLVGVPSTAIDRTPIASDKIIGFASTASCTASFPLIRRSSISLDRGADMPRL